MSSQLDRIESMLRTLCAHLGVQSADRSGNGAHETFEQDGERRYTGIVSRFEHGWGFIECEAMNRNYFVHYSDIDGTGLRSLDAGEIVSFELAPGKDGRPKAVRVRRGTVTRSPLRPAKIEGLPQGDAVDGASPEKSEGAEAAAEAKDLPGPETPREPDR